MNKINLKLVKIYTQDFCDENDEASAHSAHTKNIDASFILNSNYTQDKIIIIFGLDGWIVLCLPHRLFK